MMGFRAMNEESVYQADAEDIPSEVSDEALETAAGNEALPAWTNICTGRRVPGLSADRLALTGFTSNCLQGAGAADSAASLLTARRTPPSCRRAITIRPSPP